MWLFKVTLVGNDYVIYSRTLRIDKVEDVIFFDNDHMDIIYIADIELVDIEDKAP